MSYAVVIWNNAGEKNSVSSKTLDEAKNAAKKYQTIDNKTVKIADAFGTLTHWFRVVGTKQNRWSERAVVGDVILSRE